MSDTLVRIEFHCNTEAFAGLRFEREVAAVLLGIAGRIENGKHTRKVYDSNDVEIGEFSVTYGECTL